MKFLLLNQFYPPDVAPTGRALHDVGRALAARGHAVDAVCSRRSYDGGRDFPARQTLDGVRIHRLPAAGFGRRGHAGRLADYASYAALLAHAALADLPRPDLVVALTTPPYVGLLAALAARLRGARHAHWIMDLYPDTMAAHGMVRAGGPVYRALASLTRSTFASASLVLTLGPHMARRLSPHLPLSPSPLHTWIPLWPEEGLTPWPANIPNPVRAERGWRPEDLVLMYSGNMGLGHRFGEFLAAADRLGPDGPQWVFAGGGRRRADIESFARAHPRARIEILPYAPADRLSAHLAAADVHLVSVDAAWQGLIVPSKIQGIFAAGRPAIFVGRRDNEIAEWIAESGGGWIVDENDVDGVLRAAAEARDPAERARRSAAAARFAAERFDRERNIPRIANLLAEIAT